MLSVVADKQARAELHADLDQLAREGARRMLAAALEAEVDDYLVAYTAARDEGGRQLVLRNGRARQRQVMTVAGSIPVRAPRVNDRRTDPVTAVPVGDPAALVPAQPPRSPRCCRCCTCTGRPPATSSRRSRRSLARQPGCRRPRWPGC
jgi:Transposase, Mutator family